MENERSSFLGRILRVIDRLSEVTCEVVSESYELTAMSVNSDCQHMTTTSKRTSERAERAQAEQASSIAYDARTASPAVPAHVAALSYKMLACYMCEEATEKLCCALLC